jgi:YVTN family beta-propeller protein
MRRRRTSRRVRGALTLGAAAAAFWWASRGRRPRWRLLTSLWSPRRAPTVGVEPAPASAGDPCGAIGYSANLLDHSVSVIDLDTNEVIDTITGFHFPWNVETSPDGTRIFVDDSPPFPSRNTNVVVVDTDTGELVRRIPTRGMVFSTASPDGTRIFATNIVRGGVQVIDATTAEVVASYATRTSPPTLAQEAVSADGETMWVVALPRSVYAVDMRTGLRQGPMIDAGALAAQFAISPDGSTLAVANLSGVVTLIDAKSRTVAATIQGGPFHYPSFAAFSPDSRRLWVGCYSGRLLVIDAQAEALVADIDVGGWIAGVHLSGDGSTAYVSTTPKRSIIGRLGIAYLVPLLLDLWSPGGVIHVFDAATLERRATIETGNVPMAIRTP